MRVSKNTTYCIPPFLFSTCPNIQLMYIYRYTGIQQREGQNEQLENDRLMSISKVLAKNRGDIGPTAGRIPEPKDNI